jgi:hypothetical protein
MDTIDAGNVQVGLLADIAAQSAIPKIPGPPCGVVRVMGELSEALASDFRAAVDGPYDPQIISDQLAKRGVRLSGDSIRRHRNAKCKCRFGA